MEAKSPKDVTEATGAPEVRSKTGFLRSYPGMRRNLPVGLVTRAAFSCKTETYIRGETQAESAGASASHIGLARKNADTGFVPLRKLPRKDAHPHEPLNLPQKGSSPRAAIEPEFLYSRLPPQLRKPARKLGPCPSKRLRTPFPRSKSSCPSLLPTPSDFWEASSTPLRTVSWIGSSPRIGQCSSSTPRHGYRTAGPSPSQQDSSSGDRQG